MSDRVTQEIVPYYNGKWRATVYVDRQYDVAHKVFDSHRDAAKWARERAKEVEQEVVRE